MRFGAAFDGPRLHAIGTMADRVAGDRCPLHARQGAQGVWGSAEQVPGGGDRLPRRRKADGSRQLALDDRGLGDRLADQVVGQPVRPNLLADHFRALAAERLDRERLLDRPQIEFHVPAGAVQLGHGLHGIALAVGERGDQDQLLHAKAGPGGPAPPNPPRTRVPRPPRARSPGPPPPCRNATPRRATPASARPTR